MDNENLKINPPLYMIGRKTACWRCGAIMPVIALLAPKVDDTEDQVCILSGIDDIPKEVLSFIQSKVPTFVLKYSKTVGRKYFANTCPKCRVIYDSVDLLASQKNWHNILCVMFEYNAT